MTQSRATFLRGVIAGCLAPLVVGVPTAAALLPLLPDLPFLGTVARMLENVAPHMLVAVIAPCLVLWLARLRGLAATGLALSGIAAGLLLSGHLRIAAAPPAPLAANEVPLRLIWFNALWENVEPPEQIVDAVVNAGADVVILGESLQLGPYLPRLEATFPYRLGCKVRCEVLVLSRHPFDARAVRSPGPWPERLLVVDLHLPGAEPVTLVGLHLVKPWFFGLTNRELDVVTDTLAQFPGPMVLAGDLNSAPWGRRMQELMAATDLAPPRRPLATWPTAAGPFGVPIDHILTRNGPRFITLKPWGEALGSDHRGLEAVLAIPAAPPERDGPPAAGLAGSPAPSRSSGASG